MLVNDQDDLMILLWAYQFIYTSPKGVLLPTLGGWHVLNHYS
jgi:hypothetical protein